ncbi:MAG TPA: amino acid ABC transporter substrate-binding protein [Anaerolineae bacterium]|nr:amino acid ABC transporter substrate-binding protein [Anaerolineae bacterium]HIP70340.1 amino acid ABC transporter substrate-binding protein [Anaerolineae bacterium]
MNTKRITLLVLGMTLLALVLAACGGGETVTETVTVEVTRIVEVEVAGEAGPAEAIEFAGGGDTLASVQAAGILNCGVSGALVGFSYVQDDGTLTGFDWDYCRAIAAAALGDADAVEGRSLTSTERFPVLQSGEIDVLVRNTTWTTSRDTSLGFNFAPTTFYDGQGMMVRKDSGITDLEGLEGGTVCVAAGTTTEKNLADVFRSLGIEYEAVVFTESDGPRLAYDEGRCDGWTTDKSGLVANKTLLENPDDHVILEATMSKEPLGPLVRHGDDNWFDIVKWTVFCTILAEDLGVNQGNVDEMLGSDDPQVLNLLGVEGDLGQAMGLNNDFCYQVIKQVGNYEDIYNANLGPDTPVNLARGVNAQWTEGGLLYSPPFR